MSMNSDRLLAARDPRATVFPSALILASLSLSDAPCRYQLARTLGFHLAWSLSILVTANDYLTRTALRSQIGGTNP